MEENGAIYARLINELYDAVCEATGNVGNIDKNDPNEATISSFSATSVTVGGSVTATVTQSDSISGIDIKNCKYAFTIGNTELGTDDVSKYTGTFEKETSDTLTLTCPTVGTYYLHVLSVDRAGNRRETISSSGVQSTVTYDLVSGGNFMRGEPTVARANTWSEYSSGFANGSWQLSIGPANGYGSLTSVYWKIPAVASSARLEASVSVNNHYATNYNDMFLFGAGVPPTGGAVWNALPFGNSYGCAALPQSYGYTDPQGIVVSLNGITDPLYVGFAPYGPSWRIWSALDYYSELFANCFLIIALNC